MCLEHRKPGRKVTPLEQEEKKDRHHQQAGRQTRDAGKSARMMRRTMLITKKGAEKGEKGRR